MSSNHLIKKQAATQITNQEEDETKQQNTGSDVALKRKHNADRKKVATSDKKKAFVARKSHVRTGNKSDHPNNKTTTPQQNTATPQLNQTRISLITKEGGEESNLNEAATSTNLREEQTYAESKQPHRNPSRNGKTADATNTKKDAVERG
ncbi:hypothetical protein MTR_2g066205 [Medicago truncatula]|uniref:Uncharacterized protein n=1 Tax=Medicago truncatula TaxID=3880 RepID=A0A072VA28_MEDTR|nr:hypothetical protein MTR_2g066205 [Medicago truncatula]